MRSRWSPPISMSSTAAYRTEAAASARSSSIAIGSSYSSTNRLKSSSVSRKVVRPTSVSRNGGWSIAGGAPPFGSGASVRNCALVNEALRIGRMERSSSQPACSAFANACRNVLLPAFWSPSSKNVYPTAVRCAAAAPTAANGEDSETSSSTSSSCRSGCVQRARCTQPSGYRSARAGRSRLVHRLNDCKRR